jgi:hypothetical protein
MKRRDFISLLGGAAAVWPLAARAQQGERGGRVGVLIAGDENNPAFKSLVSAFTQALAALGWTDGRNVRMDLRWWGEDINRLRALAQELVGLQPDIILTGTTAATVAVQRETRAIPIVFATVVDPVASGLIARLDRPGGNVTGFATTQATMGGKWVELLSEIAPGLIVVLDGGVRLALVIVGVATFIEGLGEIRVKPDGPVEVRNGAVVLALVIVDIAPVVERQGEIRVKLDGLVEVRYGAVGFAFVREGNAPVVEGIGVIGVEPDGLPQRASGCPSKIAVANKDGGAALQGRLIRFLQGRRQLEEPQ